MIKSLYDVYNYNNSRIMAMLVTGYKQGVIKCGVSIAQSKGWI